MRRDRHRRGALAALQLEGHRHRSSAEQEAVVILELLGRPGTAALLEIAAGRDQEPGHAAETSRDQARVRQYAGADAEIEALLDQIDVASRAQELELDLGVALHVIRDDVAEPRGVER